MNSDEIIKLYVDYLKVIRFENKIRILIMISTTERLIRIF